MSKSRRALLWLGILGISTLAGCASSFNGKEPGSPPSVIPPNAKLEAQGPAPISYMPTDQSTLYFVDNDNQSLINTSDAKGTDDRIYVVDPVEKAVVVKSTTNPGSRIVLASPIEPSHRFSIWIVTPAMMMPVTQP